MQILYNAKIRTQNSKQPTATALAIEGGRIVAVGSDYELLAMSDRKAKKEDLGGRTIWPGLTDGHFHLEYYALGLQKVDVETETYAECLRRGHLPVFDGFDRPADILRVVRRIAEDKSDDRRGECREGDPDSRQAEVQHEEEEEERTSLEEDDIAGAGR